MIVVVELRSRTASAGADFAEMLRDVYPDDVATATALEAPAELVFEHRIVMTRHGTRPRRYGGRSYPRVGAYDEAQARRFVADEEADGFRSWVERRVVGPWKRIK